MNERIQKITGQVETGLRKLQSGETVVELTKPVTLTVYTKCPEKYKLIDMETGEEYIGHSSSGLHSWNKLELNHERTNSRTF